MKVHKIEITEDYTYHPKEIDNTCCKYCGIVSFPHSHKAGSKPKDFVRIDELSIKGTECPMKGRMCQCSAEEECIHLNRDCDCPTKYCKHYESDFDHFVKENPVECCGDCRLKADVEDGHDYVCSNPECRYCHLANYKGKLTSSHVKENLNTDFLPTPTKNIPSPKAPLQWEETTDQKIDRWEKSYKDWQTAFDTEFLSRVYSADDPTLGAEIVGFISVILGLAQKQISDWSIAEEHNKTSSLIKQLEAEKKTGIHEFKDGYNTCLHCHTPRTGRYETRHNVIIDKKSGGSSGEVTFTDWNITGQLCEENTSYEWNAGIQRAIDLLTKEKYT